MIRREVLLQWHWNAESIYLFIVGMTIDHDSVIRKILHTFNSLKFTIPASQWTILASFFLVDTNSSDVKIISICTGTKCLPSSRVPLQGEAIHDSHAEVLARRSAIRWLYEEILRILEGGYVSQWVLREAESGKYRLRDGVQLNLYVSTLPCEILSFFLLSERDR
jgi:tRNA-specific adenosine deaminase 1